MKNYLDISAVPSDEPCAQVGSVDYQKWPSLECLTLVGQIRRILGPEPEGVRLITKANPHDFGTYYEVVCTYDDDLPASEKYALDCEGQMGHEWDEESKRILTGANYPYGSQNGRLD